MNEPRKLAIRRATVKRAAGIAGCDECMTRQAGGVRAATMREQESARVVQALRRGCPARRGRYATARRAPAERLAPGADTLRIAVIRVSARCPTESAMRTWVR